MYTIQVESRRKTETINFHLSIQIKYLQGLVKYTTLKHYIFTEIDVGWVCFWCQSLTRDF